MAAWIYAARKVDRGSWPEFHGWAAPVGEAVHAETALPIRIRRLVDGASMVLVPGGLFKMGAGPDDTESWADELPPQVLTVSPFYVDVHEVTNGQFRAFVEATGYPTEALLEDSGYGLAPAGAVRMMQSIPGLTWRDYNACRDGPPEDHPVTCVTWRDAVAYCDWVGAALPMEHEYEYLLRLDVGSAKYPWGDGDTPPPKFANLLDADACSAYPAAGIEPAAGNDYRDGFVGTAPVMSFSPNSLGIFDICGNVFEWCAGVSDGTTYSMRDGAMNRDPSLDNCGRARGGSWSSCREWQRCAIRKPANRRIVRAYLGFRCAWRQVKLASKPEVPR
ncbi:MAG: SUMF1/EgtB/PvdO family nonheme iron enzyme [Planctomycetota bacterium]|nr:SUMF1/EgtB/PvdO family nonheme iron enzyme [Planctomycetota bacterium]